MNLLSGTTDIYGGFSIDPEQLSDNVENFSKQLDASIIKWEKNKYRLIWLHIPQTRSELVPIAVGFGFSFHHAEPGMVMMTLPLATDSHIPFYATHNVGGGAVVIDKNSRILVVSERFRRDRSRPFYKLPGGSLDPQENLVTAVEREVAEETGVRTKFEGVVCIRHRHQFRFGRSDLYIVCRLKPLTNQLRADPNEIEECRWMDISEYLKSPYVGLFNRKIVEYALKGATLIPRIIEDTQNYEFFTPN